MESEEKKPPRDHRELGQLLDLFSFQEIAPGAPFWHPKGMIIFKELEKYLRGVLENAGYQEIATPIMVKKEVFEKSGHWQYYRDNMFWFANPRDDKEVLVVKPMNCPESTYVYNSQIRSYKDLPLRLSEIGRLHRNELSGTLGGMFRVRQITMDDAHIYCRPDQIQKEISGCLKLIINFYQMLGFQPEYFLATKPDGALGNDKTWDKAEKALAMALEENRLQFGRKEKDGAFYGPKIDIHIKDSLGRDWQLATVQLDFVMLPERFDLAYIDKNGAKKMPVVIHRAIFGSFERFVGVLLEHFDGQLPFWLAPIQMEIINIGAAHQGYGRRLQRRLNRLGFRARLSDENLTVAKRIREAEIKKIPYLLVVGDKELENQSVNVRHGQKGPLGEMKTAEFLKKIKEEIKKKTL